MDQDALTLTPSETATPRKKPAVEVNAELILRDEVRAIRELWMRVLQWGITVMTGAGSVIFYARRAIKDDMIALGTLVPGQPIPLSIYLIGTAFLLMLAYVFTVLSGMVSRRYRSYFDQLTRVATSGVHDDAATGHSRWLLPWLFFLFPIFDVLLRIYYFELSFAPK